MKRAIIIFITLIILVLIIILIDANMTYKPSNPENNLQNSSSSLIDIIKTSSCQANETKISFILFKQEQILEIWLHSDTCHKLIKTSSIQINNKSIGPRLYDDDVTIPEGIYQFKPLSDSLAIIIDYPNEYDIIKAHADSRDSLNAVISIKPVVEDNTIALKENELKEIYNLLKQLNRSDVSLIIVPSDIRKVGQFPSCNNCPHWIFELYGQLKLSIVPFQD